MDAPLQLLAHALPIGVGATVVIDLWALLLARFGVSSLKMAMLGRWVGHLARGRWRHDAIATAAPIRGEAWIGWGAHYAIGVTFAALLLQLAGPAWANDPTPAPALAVGLGTVVAPWFLLQPGMGAGIASAKTPRPLFNALKSLVTHAVFGLGLYLAAQVARLLG